MKKTNMPMHIFFFCILLLFVFEAYPQGSQKDTEKEHEILRKLETGLVNGQHELSHYNTARYFVLAGKPELAFGYLFKAVHDGFSRLKDIETDSDLLSLHSDPRWPGVLKRVGENSALQQKTSDLFFNKKSFWEPGILETPYKHNITENEKIAGLSKFWSEVKYNFVNFDLIPDVNFDSLYFGWLPKVRRSASTKEYYLLLQELAANLRDSHTLVLGPSELVDSVYARPLVRTRLIEDKVLIVGVYDPALSRKGISIGQEVVKVNGVPVKDYAARHVIPYVSASTLQDKMVRAYDYALLGGSVNQPIRLQLRDASNNIREHTIFRVTPGERSRKLQAKSFEYRMLKGDIAYVALNTFANDSTAIEFAARFEEISKAKAIIFDVRNNGGGSTAPGWDILSYLIDKPTQVHSSYTRDYKPTYRAWNYNQSIFVSTSHLAPDKKVSYTKPVIVLTSARTFSAAEDFAAAFKTLNWGLIIGEATGGSSGQPLGISLPGNGTARICTKRDMLGNGEDFVGKGISPDKIVAPTIYDVRKGVDTELQAAISELMK
jgi:C-terminal processing protease CtpA/Prc